MSDQIPTLPELKVRLTELENYLDETLLYSPKGETESQTQKKTLKVLNDNIQLLRLTIQGGGIHRVN
jgi:hypothetical protein